MPPEFHAKANADFAATPQPHENYYELLQVSPKADPEIIEAAYRRLALKYHPDHNPAPEATLRMQTINEAYNTLKDAQRRAEYDCLLAEPLYTGDLTDDDYEPPPRRSTFRVGLAPESEKPGSFSTLLGWLVAALLLVGLGAWWLGQTASQATGQAVPTSTGPLPTPTLPEGSVFLDEFESVGAANWLLQNPWHLTSRYSASGKYSMWFGEEARGRYQPGLNVTATLARPLDLSGATNPTLRFKLVGQSDHDTGPSGEDRLFIELSEGGRDFQTIFSASGLYANWQEISLDLSRWKGKSVILRFRFSSGTLNSGAGFSGFFVDDVRVDKGKF